MKFLKFSKLFGARWSEKNRKKSAPRSSQRASVQLRLEELEDRLAPSVTPILPEVSVSDVTTLSGGYSPTVVINPVDSMKMVEVHTTGSGLAGSYTIDGGQTWQNFALGGTIVDPNLDQYAAPQYFTNVDSPSVAFDMNETFYVVSVQHDAANTSGAIVINQFTFAGSKPALGGLTQLLEPQGWAAPPVYQLTASGTDNQIEVESTFGFPGGTPFSVIIGSGANAEELRVTNVSGTTWDVIRGWNGTTISAHALGSPITYVNPNPPVSDLGTPNVLYRWYNQDAAYNPVVAVDTNPVTYTDPETFETQTDSMAKMRIDSVYGSVPKAIYVAWNVNSTRSTADTPVTGAFTNEIMVVGSEDGGNHFSTMQRLGNNITTGIGTAPQILFTQGTADGDNQGGLLTFFWSNGTSIVMDQSSPDGGDPDAPVVATQNFTFDPPGAGTVTDGATSSGNPDITGVTTFTGTVTFTEDNLTTINDLDVTLNLVHPDLDQIDISLIGPDNVVIRLVRNRTDNDGTPVDDATPANVGLAAGVNLGVLERGVGTNYSSNSAGTVFDQDADRRIAGDNPIDTTINAGASYVGHFRPESVAGTNLDHYNGMSTTALTGTWTLVIKDHRFSGTGNPVVPPRQFLKDWSLHFTGIISTSGFGAQTTVPLTTALGAGVPTVTGSSTNTYATTNAASGTNGIGPSVSIVQDKTLGSFSPYQGRIYLAYTNGNNGTDVRLVTSDDNGATWSSSTRINDDVISDNFSEGVRPQFTPAITVDNTTGTLVVTYYDAREDAAAARVNRAVVVSIDGGDNFSDVTYVNDTRTATDFLTGKTVDMGDVPGNQAGTNFGDRQGVVAYGGKIFPVFASNANAGGRSITTASVTTAAGPRIIDGDMGAVTATFASATNTDLTGYFYYNNQFATDGTRKLDGFVIQFDRPIDVSTFSPADVLVKYQNPDNGVFSDIVVSNVSPLDMPTSLLDAFGPRGVGINTLATTFYVLFQTPQTNIGTYSYAIGPDVSDKIRSGDPYVVPGTTLAPVASTDVPKAISDFVTSTSTLTVSGVPANQVVANVTVTLDITHTYDADLDITLISPSGTRITLSTDNGGGGANYTNTTFDDNASTPITAGSAPFTGSFQPEELLAGLAGEAPNGVWTLEIRDDGFFDSGTLNSWSLTLTPGTLFQSNNPGNKMDQNANSLTNEGIAFTSNVTTTINMPGLPGGLSKTAKTMDVASSAGFTTSLNGGINNAVTTIVVAASTSFPTSNFNIRIGSEELHVVSRVGNTWQVLRGQNGTTAVAHANGDQVQRADPFTVQIENEQVLVTNIAGTTWTIDRGWNGTQSAAHADGVVINSVNTPDMFSVPTALAAATDQPIVGVPFSGVYDSETLPLIIPGAHIVSTSVPGATVRTTTISQFGGLGDSAFFDDTITVASTANFPTSGGFAITIDNEQIWVDSVDTNTNTLSVTRGFNDTVVTAHANGSLISVGDSFDNLIVNGTVSAIDVTFDRDINGATFTNADIISITGPVGPITGTFSVTQLSARTFRIGFPTQTFSGSYSVLLGSQITDSTGKLIDNNLNAGVNVLRGASDPQDINVTLTREVYSSSPAVTIAANTSTSVSMSINDVFNIFQSTTGNQFSDGQTTTINLVGGISAIATSVTVQSSVGFPTAPFTVLIGTEQIRVTAVSGTNWTIQRGFNGTTAAFHANGSTVTLGKSATIQMMLNVSHLDVRDLTATLTAPDGTTVTLFDEIQFGGNPHSNFVNTVFDDTATTPIQLATTPVTVGPFNPQTPLTVLDGHAANGNWTLTITNNGATTGTINQWQLRLPKAKSTNGLGETFADRSTANFRIFTQATSNAQSYTQWTPIGPSGNTENPNFNGDNAGSVKAIAIDPSDSSGNTVYIGAASGGVWKTSNYLTNDPNGPTWIALTDLGPSSTLNIGSIAVIGRNNDPNQSIIVVGTGNGTETITQLGSPAQSTTTTQGATGIGFLRSMDGGRTWQVLDSLTNTDLSNNILTMNSVTRDHTFVGSTVNKVVADPTLQVNGHAVLYAAVSGTNGGLYRSLNSGNTWSIIRAGDATDVTLPPASKGATGLLTVLYAAFEGEGVYEAVGNASTTSSMTLMAGGGIFISRVDQDDPSQGTVQVPTLAPSSTPNGAKGQIVLATPALMNNPLGDSFYQRWLYAAVSETDGTFDGLYVTKDGGDNWTKINLPVVVSSGLTYPTNNETRANYDPVSSPSGGAGSGLGVQNYGNYSLSLVVDPNDPAVVFLGGTSGAGTMGTTFRIDITKLDDPYSLNAYQNNEADGGLTETATDGPTNLNPASTSQAPYGVINQFDSGYDPQDSSTWVTTSNYLNLYREPNNPFRPATLQFTKISSFNNAGTGAFWMPLNNGIDIVSNQHQIVATKDPTSGGTRLLFANDQGVYTSVTNDRGDYLTNIGASTLVNGSRNGNLQIAQMTDGAAQPSTLAADLAGALFYGSAATGNGYPQSADDILNTGDLRWSGESADGIVNGNVLATGEVIDGARMVTDQGGAGALYQSMYPSTVYSPFVTTDFFQVTEANTATAAYIGGLVQIGDQPGTNDGQWSQYQGYTFAVNPIEPNSAVMASQNGRVFLTSGDFSGGGTNITWNVIATPAQLGTSVTNSVTALAFGSRNPANNEPSDLIYAGTENGNVFVTFTAGGWYNISAGLDGSRVKQIVTNPKPGSHELYAVTTTGVFWMQDASPVYNILGAVVGVSPNARWIKISDTTGASSTITQSGGIPAVTTTTLNGNINNSQTTITVQPTTQFPTPNFVIQIGTEQMQVTGVAGNVWTVTRGFNGTTAAAALNGATITGVGTTTRVTVADGTTFPPTPFMASIGNEVVQVTAISNTTTTLNGAIDNSQTSITVQPTSLFPPPNFVIQIGAEQMQVTGVAGNVWTVTRGFNGTTAAAAANGATVTGAGTMRTLTIARGQQGTTPAAHANGVAVNELNKQLFSLSKGNFNNNSDQIQTLEYLTTIQADWRYAIPDAGTAPSTTINFAAGITATDTTVTVASSATFPQSDFVVEIGSEQMHVTNVTGTVWTIVRGYNGTTAAAHLDGDKVTQVESTNFDLRHPVLYVAGEGGVFRSRDNGVNWTYFPNVSDDGAPQEGGYLPNTNITSLDLILGNVDPNTGFTDNATGLNMLVATTYGRGQFAIRLDNSDVAIYAVAPISGPQVVGQSSIVANNGQQLAGLTITFGGAVDPVTFDISDVTVTGPGGPVSIASIVNVNSSTNDVFQILFTTPQSAQGNYTVNIGPNILDFAGSAMNQDNDNLNGENPADIYTNTFNFTANVPPTITAIVPDPLVLNPGATSAPLSFTIGDAETSVNLLSVTATSSATGVIPNANITLGLGVLPGERTITITAPGAAHGQTTITVTVTDGSGLTTTDQFFVNVTNAPTWNTIANPTVVAHGSTPTNINLNVQDADGDNITATVSLHDPLFDVKDDYGLGVTSEQTQYFNYRGLNEKYFLSTNGSNPAGAGYYILMPTNELYAWAGSMAATLASSPVEDFTSSTYGNADVYANTKLLTDNTGVPLVTVDNPLYDLKVKYGLDTAASYFNYRGANEWYLHSSNGSNPTGGGYYLLLPNNTLVEWTGSLAQMNLVADLTPYGNVYATPSLLTSAALGTTVGLTAMVTSPITTFPGGTLTLTPTAGFDRTAIVTVSISDGLAPALTQTFTYQVNNSAPTVQSPIGNHSITHDTATDTFNVSSNFADAGDSTATTYSVAITGSSSSYPFDELAGRYGLDTAAQYYNYRGANEWYFQSSNGSNPGNGGWYLLYQNKLYAWDSTSVTSSANQTPLADFGTAFYGNTDVQTTPSILSSARKVGSPSTYNNRGPLYDLKVLYGLTTAPQYFNYRGSSEWYFQSSNGSNAANGGFYVLLPNGSLRAWNSASIGTSTQVADLSGTTAYFNPSHLYNASPQYVNDQFNNARQTYGLYTANQYDNYRGQNEKYLLSSNGSNAAGGGWYVLTVDGNLRAWDLVSVTTSPVVVAAALIPGAYANPSMIYSATGQSLGVTMTPSSNTTGQITLDRNIAFAGSVRVTVTASDGADKTSQSFVFTVTNNATTLASIGNVTGSSAAIASTPIALTASGNDGSEAVTFRASVSQNPLYQLKTLYGLNTADQYFNYRLHNEKYLYGSNTGTWFLLTSDNKLYAWDTVSYASTVAQTPVADFSATGPDYLGTGAAPDVYGTPSLLYNATASANLSLITWNFTGASLTINPNGFTGQFLMTVYAGDGNSEVQRTFLVTVTP